MKKVLSLLLSLTIICASFVTFVIAAPTESAGSNMTLKAEVTEINSSGYPVITVSMKSDDWFVVENDGYVDDVLGVVSATLSFAPNTELFSLGSRTWSEVQKPSGDAVTLIYNGTTKTFELGFATGNEAQVIYSDAEKFAYKFAVKPVDSAKTVADYASLDLGEFKSIFIQAERMTYDADSDSMKSSPYRIYGTTDDCNYVVDSVVTGPEATEEPTATPTAEPTATPTAEPTATPTAEPTATPTAEPTATPTAEPTATPTAEPTATPTAEPADKVTVDETATAVAADTAFWGVKILEAAEANITAKFETDTESKEVTLVNAADLDGNGDLAFNLYLKLTGERVGKAVTATVTVGDDSDSGVWAAAN